MKDRLGYWRAYYAANRERIRVRQQAYHAANREVISARHRAYKSANRVVIKVARELEVSRAQARALLGIAQQDRANHGRPAVPRPESRAPRGTSPGGAGVSGGAP